MRSPRFSKVVPACAGCGVAREESAETEADQRRVMRGSMLPIRPPYPVMDAQLVERIPVGPQWVYEPKWDGFRCLAFRDGDEIELQAKSGKSLSRFFPDIVSMLGVLDASVFVIDSELVIPVSGSLSFEELQLRLHPAESRVGRLAAEHPATMIAFDLLVDDQGRLLTTMALRERRKALELFHGTFDRGASRFRLSPTTVSVDEAQEWLRKAGTDLDGIVAKRLDVGYRSGERSGMVKYKNIRSADCVVGGFRYAEGRSLVGSLLLGLYGHDSLLHHVGYTSSIRETERVEITARLEALRGGPGFTGRSPGGPSRWSSERSAEWEALKPELVVEVEYDHFSGGRFRHGTHLMRWRPDKAASQCTFDQIGEREGEGILHLLKPTRAPNH
jgi:ATP-dependent DNA ligase